MTLSARGLDTAAHDLNGCRDQVSAHLDRAGALDWQGQINRPIQSANLATRMDDLDDGVFSDTSNRMRAATLFRTFSEHKKST